MVDESAGLERGHTRSGTGPLSPVSGTRSAARRSRRPTAPRRRAARLRRRHRRAGSRRWAGRSGTRNARRRPAEQSGVEHTHGFTRAGRARPRPRGILRARIQVLDAPAASGAGSHGRRDDAADRLRSAGPGAPAASARADAVLRSNAGHHGGCPSQAGAGAGHGRWRGAHPRPGRVDDRVPASTTMHFRNGRWRSPMRGDAAAVLVDQNKVGLDDKASQMAARRPTPTA